MSTRTLYHPTLNTSVEVADTDASVKRWADQGWRKTKPKDAATEKPASDK